MSRWYEPTEEQLKSWAEWVAARPEPVRKAAERFPPWELFEYNQHKVYAVSYQEHDDDIVTLTVRVDPNFNLVAFGRDVFGVDQEELTVEADLPKDGDLVGALLASETEVEEFITLERSYGKPRPGGFERALKFALAKGIDVRDNRVRPYGQHEPEGDS